MCRQESIPEANNIEGDVSKTLARIQGMEFQLKFANTLLTEHVTLMRELINTLKITNTNIYDLALSGRPK